MEIVNLFGQYVAMALGAWLLSYFLSAMGNKEFAGMSKLIAAVYAVAAVGVIGAVAINWINQAVEKITETVDKVPFL
jgi:hypothetical protein